MDEQKLLDMMSQILTEVSGLKQDITGVKQDMAGMKQEMSGLKQLVDKLTMRQESEIIPRLELLYEGHVTLQRQLQDRASEEALQEVKSDIRMHADEIKRINQVIKTIQDDVAVLKRA